MYFDKFNKIEDVKKRYRLLSKLFHPDIGGDTELMQELNLAYESKMKTLNYFKKIEDDFEDECEEDELTESEYQDLKSEKTRIFTEYKYKIIDIIEFASFNKNFDAKFVQSVYDNIIKYSSISQAQCDSIDRIYVAFRVEEKLKEYKQKKN